MFYFMYLGFTLRNTQRGRWDTQTTRTGPIDASSIIWSLCVRTTNEISVYYIVNKLGSLDMNLCFCGTTLLPDICKFAMKYLLNIYESLWCLHIYKYLHVHYKVTTKFLWYIHIYGITMSLYGYYNLYNIFQSLLMSDIIKGWGSRRFAS